MSKIENRDGAENSDADNKSGPPPNTSSPWQILKWTALTILVIALGVVMASYVPSNELPSQEELSAAAIVAGEIRKEITAIQDASVFYEAKQGEVSINVYGVDDEKTMRNFVDRATALKKLNANNLKMVVNFFPRRQFSESRDSSGRVMRELVNKKAIATFVLNKGE